jgi:uncharacterized protein YjbI with pentapeptide repeats
MALEVFICYRRKDTGGYAGRIYDHLVQRFGKDGVLFDVSAGGTAELLREWVIRVVPNAAAIVVLLGEEWLTDRSARRRIHESDDIVRLEIELALQNQIPIIPILIDGAVFPKPMELPDSIKALAQFKAYELNNTHWETRIEPLMEAISSVTTTHVHILKRGVPAWNDWRAKNPTIKPHLAHGGFAGTDLSSADLSNVNLSGADLSQSVLRNTDFGGANLSRAKLGGALLENAILQKATLTGADLSGAKLTGADLDDADLTDVNLNECDLAQARITNCDVYGVSAWNTRLEHAIQSNLRLTRSRDTRQRVLTVDSVQTAVVVNLLLESGGFSTLLDALCSKIVLVLRRFTPDREGFWDALKEELVTHNYVAISFDFEAPTNRSLSDTMMTLASLSRFIIADIRGEAAVPFEFSRIIPQLVIPIVPLLDSSQEAFDPFADFDIYPWVLKPTVYAGTQRLSQLVRQIVNRAEANISEQMKRRREYRSPEQG